MWELDYRESWAQKNWCFWTGMLEMTLESPLDCKKIKSVNPKGNQFWIFIGRTDTEAEIPVLWPPDAKRWLIWEDPDAGKDWRWKKGTTENEIVWWHYWINSQTKLKPLAYQILVIYLTNVYWTRSVQLLSPVQLFATPWTAACQASLSITHSRSLLKVMSIDLVMPSNYLILCHSLLLLPSVFQRLWNVI